jgi:hypothetical protein
MKFIAIRPMLWTDKFDETFTFYTCTPGFSCGSGNDDWGWANLYRDNEDIVYGIGSF